VRGAGCVSCSCHCESHAGHEGKRARLLGGDVYDSYRARAIMLMIHCFEEVENVMVCAVCGQDLAAQ
jgi:hypothetical protein